MDLQIQCAAPIFLFSAVSMLNGITHGAKPSRSHTSERDHQQPNSWHQLGEKKREMCFTKGCMLTRSQTCTSMLCSATVLKVIRSSRFNWNHKRCAECKTLSSLHVHANQPIVLVMEADVHTLTHPKKTCNVKLKSSKRTPGHQLTVKCGREIYFLYKCCACPLQ